MCLQFSMNGQRKRNETRIGAEFYMGVDIVASFALFLLFFFLLRIYSFSNDGSFDNFVQHWNSTRRNQLAVGKRNHEYSREKNMKNVAFSILKFFFFVFRQFVNINFIKSRIESYSKIIFSTQLHTISREINIWCVAESHKNGYDNVKILIALYFVVIFHPRGGQKEFSHKKCALGNIGSVGFI